MKTSGSFSDAVAFILPIASVYRPELIAAGERLLRAAGAGQLLTPAEADTALTGLISRARGFFDTENLSRIALQGACSWAQSALGYWLDDVGLAGKPVAFQSILGRRDYYNHVWTTVSLPLQDGPQWFLLDPTYQQFCVVTKHGQCAARDFPQAQALANNGFIALTPQIAMDYFTALNLGRPLFENAPQAMDFMMHPPGHKHNMWFPREMILGV